MVRIFNSKTAGFRRYSANSRLFLTSHTLNHVFSAKRRNLGGMVRIHHFLYSRFTSPHFQLKTEGLGGMVRIHDFFLLYSHCTTLSTHKRRNLGGIHDFVYSGFNGPHFQLKNGDFRRYGANSRLFLTSHPLVHILNGKTVGFRRYGAN